MAQTSAQIAYPEWTEYRKKNGLDPLGMQTSSVGLYQAFLPGISNVTLRVRYYGLYAWLCRTYARRVGDTNPKTWQRFIRRAEALFALIAQKHGNEGGVAGIQWAERTLQAAGSDVIDFSSAAEPGSDTYYLKQAWGAYGAAYASQLFEVGLFSIAEGHTIPVPGAEIGDPMATAFEEAAGPAAEQFFETVQHGSVTLADLERLASLIPSAIHEDSAERSWYEKILFAQAGLERESDKQRRLSLLLILKLASELGHVPGVSDIRWSLYTGYDLNGSPLNFGRPDLYEQRLRWRIYQANDLTHIAYETLLKYMLDLLEPFPGGLTLESLIGGALEALESATDNWPQTWGGFVLDNVTDDPYAEEALCAAAMQAARQDSICTPEGAWKALKLLAVVYSRARTAMQDIRQELGHLDPTVFRSLLSELGFLEAHEDSTFSATVCALIEERIVRRHLWVALRKLRYQGDYTFLIESDDGRVRMRVKDGPVFTNPRLGPAITFLKDIHLIGDLGLTELGRKVLESV